MALTPKQDLGANVSVGSGLNPADQAAGTVNGTAIDRQVHGNPLSCVLIGAVGAASGSPSAQTYDLKIQDSADGSTGWADVSGAALTQITADNTLGTKDVDLSAVKRYVRLVRVVGFTGGTSPAIECGESVVFGGAHDLPQS